MQQSHTTTAEALVMTQERPQAYPWPTAKCMRLLCRLMASTPVIHVIMWITTHLPTPKGWKAELAWLVDP